MKIFGVQLRSPGLSDLPVVVFSLACAVAFSGFFIIVLGQDIAKVAGIIYGFTSAGIASACGVDFRHGVRGILVVFLIMLALVASTVGLHLILN